MKVGITIPNYGRPDYLKEAVDSVLAQTHADFELLIVDDRSPDPAVKEYLAGIKDPRVKWVIHETNLGTAKNYDTALRLLDRDVSWAMILDNDDVLERDYLKEMVKAHEKYPAVKVICGRQIFVDAAKRFIREDEPRPEFEDAEAYLLSRCRGRRDLRSSNVFFEMKRFLEVGGYPQFPSGMGTDTVLIFALAFGNQLAYAPSAKISIRVHDGAESITTDHLWEKLASMKRMPEYCEAVYQRHSNAQRNKGRVLKALKDHVRIQASGLLTKRYREIVLTENANAGRASINALLHECAAQRIDFSGQFFLLAKCFSRTGIDLESLSLYKGLVWLKKNLNPKALRQKLKNVPAALYLYRHLQILPKFATGTYAPAGVKHCPCCGCFSLFYWDKWYADLLRRIVPPWGMSEGYTEQMVKRENDVCAYCRSNFRTRAHAAGVLKTFNCRSVGGLINFLKSRPDFKIYEAASYHLFRRPRLKAMKNYIVSEFHPDVPFGQEINGVRNENLEALTFADESLDAVITSEVLEHVSDLSKALSEIHRVLKTGGHHIFTIPVDYGRDSIRVRAVVGAGGVEHLCPPAIHGDDITSGVLAFRDFGRDVAAVMQEYGFVCAEEKYDSKGKHLTSVYVCQKV